MVTKLQRNESDGGGYRQMKRKRGSMKKFLKSLLFIFATMCALPAFADDLCKNLWTEDNFIGNGYYNGGQWQPDGGMQGYFRAYDINVEPNTDYTMFQVGNVGWGGIVTFWDGTNYIQDANIGNASERHMRTPANCNKVTIVTSGDVIRTVQLEKGSTATSYVPYNPLCATCQGIVRESPNLFDIDAMFNGRSANYSKNTDGKLNIISRDSSAWSSLINTDGITLPAGTYTLSTTSSNIKMNCKLASDMDHDLTSQTTITFTLNSEDTLICKIFEINQEYPVNSVEIQLERGDTATEYHPYGTTYCADAIKIATTAYNDAAFAPVEVALESAVTTIKDVVANTIVQADAIQNLQDAKQTRPDAECPKFRQCLLIETANGTPQWFQIADPVHDLVLSLKNNKVNSSGETTEGTFAANGYDGTNGTTDSRYFRGYQSMQLQTVYGDTPAYTHLFSSTLLNDPNLGGQYKILNEQEWAVTWNGDETGTADSFLPGVIYGTSRCVRASQNPSGTQLPGSAGWTLIENSEPLNDLTNIEDYKSCWCKMTGVGLDGAITPVRDSSRAPWSNSFVYETAGLCAHNCAYDCADFVRNYTSFRQAIMGWAVE